MQVANRPLDEETRLSTLKALEVLDTGPEEELDALVRVASLVCGVPVSLVSLIDSERQFFKANIGLPGVSETPRDIAFCAHAILDDAIFEVTDASLDPRFSDNPLVTGHPDIRFYAGAPITMGNGQRIGTLCVIDRAPKRLSDVQRDVLSALAVAAAQALEGRRAMRAFSEVSRALQDTQDRVSLATKIAGVGIWHFELSSGALQWDAQMYRLYGLQPCNAAAAYALWSKHVHADDLAESERRFQHSLATGEDYDHTFRVVWNDGAIRFVKALGRVQRDSNGEVIGMVGTNKDVTDRTLQEQILKTARDTAEAANRSKGQFLANMSHEIRTPMNSIIGMTRMVLDSELNSSQRDYLQKAHYAANSLLRVLNDILDFSKISAGQLQLEALPFDLSTSLTNVEHMFELQLQKKSLAWHLSVAPDVPTHLVGDALRLEQVLINLVGNAIKFTSSGGIGLRIGLAQSVLQTVGLHFEVSDSGIGMNESQLNQLFCPFTQADSSITRRYGGTGLGLSISRQLVEQMGGTMEVQSQPSVGSRFGFTVWFTQDTTTPKEEQMSDDAGRNFVASTPGSTLQSVDWSAVTPLVRELQQLLAIRNLRARKVAQAVDAMLVHTVASTAFQRVLESVHQLDFDKAQASLLALHEQGTFPQQ